MNQKLQSIILFVSFSFVLSTAQVSNSTFRFERVAIDTNVTFAADEEYKLYLNIINLSTSTVQYAFSVISKTVPAGWRFSLCDPQSCHSPGPASENGQATLSVSGTGQLFRVTVLPTTVDKMEVEYEVYDKALPNDKKRAKVTFSNIPVNTLTLGKSSLTLTGVGNSQSVSISSNSSWTVSGLPSWLSVNSTTGTGGSKILSFTTIGTSPTELRSSVITISGTTAAALLTVFQNVGTATSLSGDLESALLVSPNPVSSAGTLYFSKSIDGEIYNLIGNLVFSFRSASQISLSNLQAGLYFLKTKSETIRITVQ